MVKTRGEMQDVLAQLVREDSRLADQVQSDPRSAIERLFGVVVPEEIEIQVVPEAADTVYVVLPHVHTVGELSDDDLEAVAGGSTVVKNVAGDVNLFEAKIES